jgi:hypothetical protein
LMDLRKVHMTECLLLVQNDCLFKGTEASFYRCGRILEKLMHMVFYGAKIKIWKLFSGATASGGSTTIGWGDDLEVLAGVHGSLSSIGLLLPCRRRPAPRQPAAGGSVSHQIVDGGGSA